MRILVTGAGGFIGSHLTERLVADGYDVIAYLHYRSDGRSAGDFHSVRGDIRDPFHIRQIIKNYQISRVYHLAALISVPYSFGVPQQFVETNINGTLNVAMACLELNVEMVHTSTSEVYGNFPPPQGLGTHNDPRSPYAASKIGADALVLSLIRSRGLNACIVRPFNTYGPRQSARAVITRIITQLVHSNVLRLGNIFTERDFTYVSDTVDAFTRVPCDGNIYVVGSGKSHSIGFIAGKIAKSMGIEDVAIDRDDSVVRKVNAEVVALRADALQMLRLGWKPQVSLDDGLGKTIMWVLDHHRQLSECVE